MEPRVKYVHGEMFGRFDVDIEDRADAHLRKLSKEISVELRRRRQRARASLKTKRG